MANRVYISPSVQDWNKYITEGTEEQHMQVIGNLVANRLRQLGFIVFQNEPFMTLRQVITHSNSLACDIHLAIHSNAGGGQGTEVWAWLVDGKETNSERLAKCVYEEIAPLSPGKDRGIKDGKTSLAEIRDTKSTAVLVELDFHDWTEGAKWIAANYSTIAEALVKAVCKYFSVKYQPEFKIILNGAQLPYSQYRQEGNIIYITTDVKLAYPTFERFSNYDVITVKPEQLAVKLVKGTLANDGVNAGYFDISTLQPIGVTVIDHKGISDRASWRPPRSAFYITEDNETGIFKPEWLSKVDLSAVKYAVAAGPSLLPAPDIEGEDIPADIQRSTFRTAVGITKEGLVKLVCTSEMTLFELSKVMRDLGCIEACNLDGGGSVNMRFNGNVIHKGRAIATAIIIKEG